MTAPTTLHEHYRTNSHGLASYADYCRLHDHFRADPRGADSFGKWIDDRIWELLQRSAKVQSLGVGQWVTVNGHETPIPLFEALIDGPSAHEAYGPTRVKLLDGTIIKEWSAKTR